MWIGPANFFARERIDPQARAARPLRVGVRTFAFLALVGCAIVGARAEDRFADITLRDAFLAETRGEYGRAAALFEQYFKKGPESAHSRSQFARVLSLEGRHPQAQEQAERAVALAPRSADVLVIYSEVMRRAGKPDLALAKLTEALGKMDESVELEFQLAEVYYQKKSLRKAQVHFRQVIFLAGTTGKGGGYRERALWRLANLHLQLGDQERSRFYFVQFVRRNPDNIFARFVLGFYLYFRRGDYDRALRELEVVAGYHPTRLKGAGIRAGLLYSALGRMYLVQNDPRAIVYLKKALRFGSTDVLDRILLMALQGRNKQALKYLNAYIKKDESDFPARIARLRILARMDVPNILTIEYMTASMLAGKLQRYRHGITLARRGLAANARRKSERDGPASHLYQQIAAQYEALEQYHRAIYYLGEALRYGELAKRWKDAGERQELDLAMARLLSRVDRHDDALTLCNRVVSEQDGSARARYVRGTVFRRMKDSDRAEQDFTKAIELDPKNFIYPFFRAAIRNDRKDFAGTESDLKRVLELKPDFAEASNFLGYLYAQKGVRLEESLRLIERAIDESPVNGAYQDSLGWVYFRLKKYERARYHLRLAALLLEEAGDPDPVVFEHLGDVELAMESPGRALSAYRKGLIAIDVISSRRELSAEEKALVVSLKRKVMKLAGAKEQEQKLEQ